MAGCTPSVPGQARGGVSLAHTSPLSAMASAPRPPQELLGSVNMPSEGAERGWDWGEGEPQGRIPSQVVERPEDRGRRPWP